MNCYRCYRDDPSLRKNICEMLRADEEMRFCVKIPQRKVGLRSELICM